MWEFLIPNLLRVPAGYGGEGAVGGQGSADQRSPRRTAEIAEGEHHVSSIKEVDLFTSL